MAALAVRLCRTFVGVEVYKDQEGARQAVNYLNDGSHE